MVLTALIVAAVVHHLAAAVAVIHLLFQDKQPINQLVWTLAIVLIPIFGIAAYLVLGTDRLYLQREHRRIAYEPLGEDAFRPRGIAEPSDLAGDCGPECRGWAEALAAINRCPPTAGNRIDALERAEDFYRELEAAIAEARERIWICTYVWRPDEVGRRFVDACARAAERGVEVRVLVDEIGSGRTPTELFDPLVAAGGRFSWATTLHPRRNRWFISLRNHRKIAVIDGAVAFTGGMNIGSEYVDGHEGLVWNDFHLCCRGPVLMQLAATFADDWHFATEERLRPPAPPPAEPDGVPAQLIAGGPSAMPSRTAQSLAAVIGCARERLTLTTPYFVPDPVLLSALELAAVRGVAVRVLVSAESDMGPLLTISRSFFEELMEIGIAVHEYRGDIHHAKCLVVDDELTMVGSINLDARSLHLNYEVGLLVRSRELNRTVMAYLEEHLAGAPALELRRFRRRSVRDRLREGAFRLLAPML